jgi:hypothetical protein
VNGDTNKHKPLSREELFGLLETKNERALPGAELDDFEREALEGFSGHSSAEKARELTKEIDELIHEKVNEKKTSRQVTPLVWLSAAASILVLVILSFYFLTETAGSGTPDLALNNKNSNGLSAQDEAPAVPPAEASETTLPAESSGKKVVLEELQQQVVDADTKNTVSRSADVSKTNKDDASTEKLKGDALDYDQLATYALEKSASEVSYGVTPSINAKKSVDMKQKDGLTTTSSEKSIYTPAPIVEGQKINTSGNGAVAANHKIAQPEDDKPVTVTAVETSSKRQEDLSYEVPKFNDSEAKQPAFKKHKKEAEPDKMVVLAGTKLNTALKEEAKAVPANSIAYYVGGEKEVKAYVLKWLKKQNYKDSEVQGIYHARIKILADGTVNVITIESEKSGYADMAEPVKKALNDMDGWKPAMINGNASATELVIQLAF